MEELLKKILYTGVGFFSLTTSKIKELINELVSDQKITEDEGKKLVDDFMDKTKDQRKEFEEQLRTVSSKFKKEGDESSEGIINALKNRIQELESQLTGSTSGADTGTKTEDINPNAAANSAISDSSGRIGMQEDTLQQAKREAARQEARQESGQNTINKVKQDERVSLSDDVLTPDKKMEAEKQRMQENLDRPSASRKEEDSQQANLGGDILTPEKKMENARQQAGNQNKHTEE